MDHETQTSCLNHEFTSQSPNNESIKSFKEFKTLKILNKKTRDLTNSSTTTFENETHDVYDDAYAQLTQNENQHSSSNVAGLDLASRPKKNRTSYNSIVRTSVHSDSYSIFNGRNRLSIAIFSDLDCVSIKDDETVIGMDEDLDDFEEVSAEPSEKDESDDVYDPFADESVRPLRRYNSHESILSKKNVVVIEPEKLNFKQKPDVERLYLGSFTKKEERFKRSFDYLRNGQLSYLTSQPVTAMCNRRAVTTTTHDKNESNGFCNPFMLPLVSKTKRDPLNFKTKDSLKQYLTDGNLNYKYPLKNIKTSKINETTIDLENKTIKRKSSIIWNLPKKCDNTNNSFNSNHINDKTPFVSVPKRQASLKITRQGTAVVDNGTEVYATKIELDLLKDALQDI
ncbi:hypothetical protein ACO0R3_001256 [Hanseniaspora guilliermondii]